jgi:hypothetical protein
VAAALAMLACALPATGAGQSNELLSIGVSAAATDIRMVGFGVGDETIEGMLYGVEGRASLWRLHLSGEYRQGRLSQEHLGGVSTRVWSARGRLGVRVLPWVVIAAGPSVSTVGSPGGNRQIVRWRVEGLGSLPLIQDVVSAFASIGGSVAGTDVQQAMPMEGGGGEVGLLVAPEGRSIWARIGYRLDREFLLPGTSQTVETGYLSIGLSAPRVPGGFGGG